MWRAGEARGGGKTKTKVVRDERSGIAVSLWLTGGGRLRRMCVCVSWCPLLILLVRVLTLTVEALTVTVTVTVAVESQPIVE